MTSEVYSFSSGFQSKIVTALVVDPSFLKESRDALKAGFFEHYDHQTVVRHILSFFDKYGERPTRESLTDSVLTEARKVGWSSDDRERILAVIEEVYSGDISQDRDYIRERVRQFGQHQALKEGLLKSVEVMTKADEEPDKYSVESILPIIQKALSVGRGTDIGIDLFDYLSDIDAIRETDPLSDPRTRVRTGIKRLDNYLGGGLGAGELGFVLGESGLGKSMMLINFAVRGLLSGKNVIYFSLELKPYSVVCRTLACMLNLTIEQVKSKDPLLQDRIQALLRIPGARHFQVKYYKPSQATTLSLRSTLARLEASSGWRPELIVVDYIDEMRAHVKSQDNGETYNTYGGIAAELIDIGVDYSCPVWTASQITRDAYGDDPNLNNPSKSIQKMEKAHVALGLCQTGDEAERGNMRLKILKNRDGGGRNHYIRCKVDFSRARIEELASADNPGD